MYTYVFICIHTYIHIHLSIYMCVCVCKCIHTYIHIHISIYLSIRMPVLCLILDARAARHRDRRGLHLMALNYIIIDIYL